MGLILFFLVFPPLSLGLALAMADRKDRRYLTSLVGLVWLLFTPLLAGINDWMPFPETSDDEAYYNLADPPVRSWREAFDLSRFIGFMEQPGYPWLLSLLNALTGHELLAYKALNLFFLLLLSLTWYRIGWILEDRLFARRMALLVVLLTPLWYYVFVLRKDMVITLLQSIFLLAAVRLWTAISLRPVIMAFLSSLLLLLFRTPVIVQNAAVLLGGITAKAFGRQTASRRFSSLIMAVSVMAALLAIASDTEVMLSLGIDNEARVIGTEGFEGRIETVGEEVRPLLFPLQYLFMETSGLSPQAWASRDAFWLRGVLALPWIFFVVPFFMLGVVLMFRQPQPSPQRRGPIAALRSSRIVSSPWGIVFLFVLSSVAISWTVGDTTRWRISDLPMGAAMALAGWTYTPRRARLQVLVGWVLAAVILFGIFRLVRG